MSENLQSQDILGRAALIAELYYIYKLPQREIAEQLGISRPWVSKLLKRAEEAGIVTVRVETVSAGIAELEDRVRRRFGLKAAKVVAGGPPEQALRSCAKALSHYLVSALRPGDVVGVCWGKTLAAVAEEFVQVEFPRATFVPLVGGVGENAGVLSNHIVATIAGKLGASYHLLHLPAFAAGKLEKQVLLQDEQVRSTIQRGETADIVLCGIGALQNSTMAADGYVRPRELEELEALGALGDIALHFINREGEIVDHPIHDRLVSGDFAATRRQVRTSIGISTGERRAPAIAAALKGGWVDVLVTDSHTAERVLELADRP